MKKTVMIALGVIILVTFVSLFAIVIKKGGERGSGLTLKTPAGEISKEQLGEAVKQEMTKRFSQQTNFIGKVGSVITPSNVDIKILNVRADTLVDLDALEGASSTDFETGAFSPEKIEKTFKVAIGESTKLVGYEKKEEIRSGDMIKIEAGNDLMKIDEFTAIEIELVHSLNLDK